MTRPSKPTFREQTECSECVKRRIDMNTIQQCSVPPLNASLIACMLAFATGCQTFAQSPFPGNPLGGPAEVASDSSTQTSPNKVVQVSGQTPSGQTPSAAASDSVEAANPTANSFTDSAKKSATRLMNFASGRQQENAPRAKQIYQEADGLFRQAKNEPQEKASKTYKKSAKLFRKAGEAAPGSALEQDALFMQAESLFFADRLPEAADTYQKLQKQYPRSRHNDRVAARLFSISRYWIDTVKSSGGSWFKMNLTDAKRPRLDVKGHAIRVLDQIRYDDPTGRLADDATMAAAAEFIRQEKYEKADEFLTDLRETFTDSDHLFLAHLLGIRCKLEIYAGPKYSGLVLEEAEKLVNQTRQRFPNQLANPKYREMAARASAEIAYLKAERFAYRADYREKRKEFGAARFNYNELLKYHGDTPQAEIARTRLAEIEKMPAVPEQRLSWLTTIFPDSKRTKPLETTMPSDGEPGTEPPTKTILR